MKKSAIMQIIKDTPLFSALSQTELNALLEKGRVKSFCTGQSIPTENEIAVILKGSVTVTKQTGEKRLLMRILNVGSVSGVASLFGEEHSALTALTAQKNTEAIFFDHDTVSNLVESNGAFAMSYIRFLTSRIRFLNGRIKAYTVLGAEAKLAYHLYLSDEAETGKIELPVSLSKLADMLDMGRASLYRAFDALEKDDIIKRNGKCVVVNDKKRLKSVFDNN